MAATREEVWEALKLLLETRLTGTAKFVSRRLKGWDQTPDNQRPALFLSEIGEDQQRKPEEPPRRVWGGSMIALVNASGDTEKPTSTDLNAFMDAVDAAFKPEQTTGRLTLGGLVRDVRVVGHNPINEGDIDGTDTFAQMNLEIVLEDDQEGSERPFLFGSGYLYATPVNKQGATPYTDQTPVRLGALRDVVIEGAPQLKDAEVGQYTFPTRFSLGRTRMKGKAHIALLDGRAINQLWMGVEPEAGAKLVSPDEVHTIPAMDDPAITFVDQIALNLGVGTDSKVVTVPADTDLVLVFVNDSNFGATSTLNGVSLAQQYQGPGAGSSTHGQVLGLAAPATGAVPWAMTDPSLGGLAAMIVGVKIASLASIAYSSQNPDAEDLLLAADSEGAPLIINWLGDTIDDKGTGAGETALSGYVIGNGGYSSKASTKPGAGATTDVAWDGAAFTANTQIAAALAPATNPTVTVVPPNGGTWSADLGVLRRDTGAPLTRVTANPASGEYTVSGGAYAFSPADEGDEVSISYLYTTTSGRKIAFKNPTAGESPSFQVVLFGRYNGREVCWTLNACACAAFAMPTAQEQFTLQEFSFEVMADTSDQIGTLSVL